jgi:TusA-related sulfurtransferase
MSGEGNGDAAIFVLGMIAGAAVSHNFGLASSPAGLGTYGVAAVIIGLAVCLFIGFTNRQKAVRGASMTNHIDATGLSCPQPVLLAMGAFKEMAQGNIEVLVDNEASKENVSRAALSQGWKIVRSAHEGQNFRLEFEK